MTKMCILCYNVYNQYYGGILFMKEGKVFCFHHGWHFLLADEFPMQKALEKPKDKNGHCFYELDYIEENWERVTLPHTFNDTDLFRDRIRDAGSGQKRTAVFYRNYLSRSERILRSKGTYRI